MSLKGSLQTVALPEVLDFLSGTGKTGELRVDGAGKEGVVWFEEGSIAGVRVQRGSNPVEAVFQLLRIEEGDFSFSSEESRPDDVVGIDREQGQVAHVLGEAQDRLRQWSDIVSVVPTLNHRMTLSAHAPSDTVALDGSQWELIVAIGEGRSVGDVLSLRGLGEFEGCSALKGLVEAHLAEIGEPVPVVEESPVTVVEEPPVAVEEEAAVAEDSPVVSAVESADEADSGYRSEAEEPGSPASFEVFKGFGSTGFATTGFGYGEESSEHSFFPATDPVAAPAEPEAVPSFESFGVGYENPEPADGSTVEPAPVGSDDRYASLRSVMDEVGRTLDDDPFQSDAADDEMVMPAFGSPMPFSHIGGESAAEPEYPEADLTNGHAALHALLAEVSSDEPETDEPVDGLADRGPWTSNELASFDGWEPEQAPAAATEGSAAIAGLFGPPPATDFAPGEEVAKSQIEPNEPPAVEQEEELAPAEEPINRGLLLKFLSSVRN